MRTLILIAGMLAACLSQNAAAAPFSALSQAAPMEAAASDIPLVVIRFNQRTVRYEQPLYNAVAKAVEIKPTVMFELISYVPANAGDQAKAAAGAQANRVAESLVKMGVPRSRLQLATEMTPEVKNHEVHVFVY